MYFALCEWWQEVPPPAIQLRRIAQFIGLQQNAQLGTARMAAASDSSPSSDQDVAMAAAMAGLPAFEGRPNDPMFDLIPPAP